MTTPPLFRFQLTVTAFLLVASALASCRHDPPAADAAPPPPPAEVDVAQVIVKPVRQWDEFSGRVAAAETVDVRPRISGYIQRIAFKEGEQVKAGDLLFVIDPRSSRAAYDGATAQLESARAAAGLAEAQARRAKALLAEKVLSEQDYETRSATSTRSNADVRAAEAAVSAARLNLAFTEVRAPIAGRVGRAMLTVGNLAQADQSVLTRVVSQDPVYIDFEPDEQTFLRYADLARRGQRPNLANPVRVGLANDRGHPHAGTVSFIDNQIDATTGTIRLRAVVPNPEGIFTPGLFAHVQLEGSAELEASLIDDKAVMTDQDRKYVYVVDHEDKVQRKDVVLGSVVDGLRIVEAGIGRSDKIVVAGAQKVGPGAPVKQNLVVMGGAASSAAGAATEGK